MTMTKKEAIRYHIEHMDDDDLIILINGINSYSGDYDLYVFYEMNEFDELHAGMTPMEIAEAVTYAYGNFYIADDYFYYDEIGTLCSCDEATAADMIRTNCLDDLVNDFMNMRNCESIAVYDNVLLDIINAEDNATFDDEGTENYKQIYE